MKDSRGVVGRRKTIVVCSKKHKLTRLFIVWDRLVESKKKIRRESQDLKYTCIRDV